MAELEAWPERGAAPVQVVLHGDGNRTITKLNFGSPSGSNAYPQLSPTCLSPVPSRR